MPDLASIQADVDGPDGLDAADRDAVAVALTRAFGDSPRTPRGYRDALYATIVALGDEDSREAGYQLRRARQYEPLVRRVVTDGGTSTGGSVSSGEINVELEIAALASELGFTAGNYTIEDVWLADSDGVIEVDLRELHADSDRQEAGR